MLNKIFLTELLPIFYRPEKNVVQGRSTESSKPLKQNGPKFKKNYIEKKSEGSSNVITVLDNEDSKSTESRFNWKRLEAIKAKRQRAESKLGTKLSSWTKIRRNFK